MPSWYDPKALTDSLELDYVHRPRVLNLWLRRCTWTAGAVSLFYIAWALWPGHHAHLQAGPLTTPHAMLNHKCSVCHTEALATAVRFWPGSHAALSTPDETCMQCHPGGAHNRLVAAENCASCHKEHRGHEALTRPSDGHCTECHAVFREKYLQSPFEPVSRFADHPEFALWRMQQPDPGNVEFSHHKHLRLEAKDFKPRHEQENLLALEVAVAKLEHMKCAYCHQPDIVGKYMQPIRFDQHCQSCHQLLIPLQELKVPKLLEPAVRAFQQEPVPHPKKGQTVSEVRAVVRERYLGFIQSHPGLESLPTAPKQQDWLVLPGMTRTGPPATPSQIGWANQQWQHAEKLLFYQEGAGCALCHKEMPRSPAKDGLPRFADPRIPPRWFEHSTFNHHAHQALACGECHGKVAGSTSHADVLMPKVADCQTCHQAKKGFARADCNECHRFHRADTADWLGKMTTGDFTAQPKR
jgi:hypothetical protein